MERFKYPIYGVAFIKLEMAYKLRRRGLCDVKENMHKKTLIYRCDMIYHLPTTNAHTVGGSSMKGLLPALLTAEILNEYFLPVVSLSSKILLHLESTKPSLAGTHSSEPSAFICKSS